MAMGIDKLAVMQSETVYSDPGFKRFLESYMNYIRNNAITAISVVDPHLCYKYEGDLYGLLRTFKIETNHLWVVMRVNDFVNPAASFKESFTLKIPDFQLIERLRLVYNNMNKKRRL